MTPSLSASLSPHSPPAQSPTKRRRRRHAPPRPITLCVAAMSRKAHSPAMQRILTSLRAASPHITPLILSEDALLDAPPSAWPRFDALLAFHSCGFPLEKLADFFSNPTLSRSPARVPAPARQPFFVNNVAMQAVLRDRVAVWDALRRARVPQPRTVVVDRGRGADAAVEDGVLVVRDAAGSVVARMQKPFVEKPVNADDHDVWVYYPCGGVRRLFRKRCDKSSEFYVGGAAGVGAARGGADGAALAREIEDVGVRAEGSYLYQEFHPPLGRADVKVYGVAGEWFHAESRKAPTVDGRVERDGDGYEVRRRVLLTPREEAVAATVCALFGQFVLGFDMLRTREGETFVIDVNGWSFVKRDRAFSDCVGRMLAQVVERECGRAAAEVGVETEVEVEEEVGEDDVREEEGEKVGVEIRRPTLPGAVTVVDVGVDVAGGAGLLGHLGGRRSEEHEASKAGLLVRPKLHSAEDLAMLPCSPCSPCHP